MLQVSYLNKGMPYKRTVYERSVRVSLPCTFDEFLYCKDKLATGTVVEDDSAVVFEYLGTCSQQLERLCKLKSDHQQH